MKTNRALVSVAQVPLEFTLMMHLNHERPFPIAEAREAIGRPHDGRLPFQPVWCRQKPWDQLVASFKALWDKPNSLNKDCIAFNLTHFTAFPSRQAFSDFVGTTRVKPAHREALVKALWKDDSGLSVRRKQLYGASGPRTAKDVSGLIIDKIGRAHV